MNAILADPASQGRFAELGASLLPGSPADFGKLLADETAEEAEAAVARIGQPLEPRED